MPSDLPWLWSVSGCPIRQLALQPLAPISCHDQPSQCRVVFLTLKTNLKERTSPVRNAPSLQPPFHFRLFNPFAFPSMEPHWYPVPEFTLAFSPNVSSRMESLNEEQKDSTAQSTQTETDGGKPFMDFQLSLGDTRLSQPHTHTQGQNFTLATAINFKWPF